MSFVTHDLAQLIRREGRLTESRVSAIVAQSALAIDALHDYGIVHNAIAARNVLLGDDDHAYITEPQTASSRSCDGLTVRKPRRQGGRS